MKYLLIFLLLSGVTPSAWCQFNGYKLIAHRGGVVNDELEENSLQSLQEAARSGYWGVELDVRMTSDSVLVAHHDPDLNRYYHIDKRVAEQNWATLQTYTSDQGNQVQRLDVLLDNCEQLGLQVMVDLKIRGFHPGVFRRLIEMLRSRDLLENALLIGTDESTDFFRGRIKLSCSIKQLKEYKKRDDYAPDDYYLFANPTAQDLRRAKRENIQVVGVINSRRRQPEESFYAETAASLKRLGITYIQLDSRFDKYFKE